MRAAGGIRLFYKSYKSYKSYILGVAAARVCGEGGIPDLWASP